VPAEGKMLFQLLGAALGVLAVPFQIYKAFSVRTESSECPTPMSRLSFPHETAVGEELGRGSQDNLFSRV
jgi:hypothetical protein